MFIVLLCTIVSFLSLNTHRPNELYYQLFMYYKVFIMYVLGAIWAYIIFSIIIFIRVISIITRPIPVVEIEHVWWRHAWSNVRSYTLMYVSYMIRYISYMNVSEHILKILSRVLRIKSSFISYMSQSTPSVPPIFHDFKKFW